MSTTTRVVTDARRGLDPTGTSKLRAAFRAAGSLQLRQLRAQLRTCIIDHDLLGLGGRNVSVMASAPDVKLAAFHHWLSSAANKYLHRDWAIPYVERAWKAGAETATRELRADHVLPQGDVQVMRQLLHQELNGIIAAIVQQVGREAARNYSSPHKAYQHLGQCFDKAADNRIVALCNTLVVATYNKAKIAVYRQANVTRVGVIPERIPRAHMHDADPDEPYRESKKEYKQRLREHARTEQGEAFEVGVKTAEDDFVCQQCQDYADGAPYDIDDAEDDIPLHVNCRCTMVPWPEVADAYNPNQTRVPAGSPGGGQWGLGTSGSGGKLKTAQGKALPPHIAALRIPPAWKDVRYSPDPKSALLVTGKDAKGRRQAIYSAAHSLKAAKAKFARIKELSIKIKAIARQNEQAEGDAADCVRLIMHSGIRPGSDADTGAASKAYGATTLEGRHVKQSGGAVRLQFVGKKGVKLDLPIDNKVVANMLVKRAAQAGPRGRLFGDLNDAALRDYVHTLDGGGFKVKDFRTLVGTTLAADMVNKIKPPNNPTGYKKAVREVAEVVSTKLGNTPTIALQSYINPTVFAPWRMAAGQHAAADAEVFDSIDLLDDLPDVYFGAIDIAQSDWRHEPDEPDPDDEEIATPADVALMLGFDPRDLFGKEDGDDHPVPPA